ncbi:unnamed protein product, partial [marine sediment metagenome]
SHNLQQLLGDIETTAFAMGERFGASAIDATQAMESLIKAGMTASEAMEAVEGALALATIEQIDSATASNLLVQALTLFDIQAKDAIVAVDGLVAASARGIDTATGYALGLSNVGATAATMGMTLDETLGALVILDNTFASASKSGTYLNRALIDMTIKTKELNLELYNADGSMKSMDEIVGQVRDTIVGYGSDQELVNKYLENFSMWGRRGIEALVGYDESVLEVTQSLKGQATATDQVSVLMETFRGRMQRADAELENNKIALGESTTGITLMYKEFAASLGPMGAFADSLGNMMGPSMLQGFTFMAGKGMYEALAGSGGFVAGLKVVVATLTGPVALAIAGTLLAIGLFKDKTGEMGDELDAFSELSTRIWLDEARAVDEFGSVYQAQASG